MQQQHVLSGQGPTVPVAAPRLSRQLPKHWWVGYLFVAPAAILFAVIGLYTVFQSLKLCFYSWNGFDPTWTPVGLDNFHQFLGGNSALTDQFVQSLTHNLILCATIPVGSCLIGLALALLLNRAGALAYVLRTVYFIPAVAAGVATFYTWQLLYQPYGGSLGVIGSLFKSVGLTGLVPYNGFLGDPSTALAGLVVVFIWANAPIAMIMYLAGLQAVPDGVLEAAQIDGANAWDRLRYIVWPLLFPVTSLLVILFLNVAIQDYQTVFVMTNGNPAGATNVVGLMVYNYASVNYGSTGGSAANMGLGSAMGWVLAALTLVVSLVNLRVFRSRT